MAPELPMTEEQIQSQEKYGDMNYSEKIKSG
jgi:hypothetical protein